MEQIIYPMLLFAAFCISIYFGKLVYYKYNMHSKYAAIYGSITFLFSGALLMVLVFIIYLSNADFSR
jgi:hypothetical protein